VYEAQELISENVLRNTDGLNTPELLPFRKMVLLMLCGKQSTWFYYLVFAALRDAQAPRQSQREFSDIVMFLESRKEVIKMFRSHSEVKSFVF